jgi:hypothetical protein
LTGPDPVAEADEDAVADAGAEAPPVVPDEPDELHAATESAAHSSAAAAVQGLPPERQSRPLP